MTTIPFLKMASPLRWFPALILALMTPMPLMAERDPFAPVPTPAAEAPFSLTFPGGTVREFVTAAQKASGQPFNVVIPENADGVRIPALDVKEVTFTPLLAAISSASMETRPFVSKFGGTGNVQYQETGFSFIPTVEGDGNKLWQFRVLRQPADLKEAPETTEDPEAAPYARFYQLKPYLDAGVKIEDITTVVQTAWKLMKLEAREMPEMKVHEETGILIAVGSHRALQVIDSVLEALPKPPPAPPVPAAVPVPVPAPAPVPTPASTPQHEGH